jgi:hypothetical protein
MNTNQQPSVGDAKPKDAAKNENKAPTLLEIKAERRERAKKAAIKAGTAILLLFAFVQQFTYHGLYQYAVLMLLPDGTNMSGRSHGTVFQKNFVRRNFAMPSYVNNVYTQSVRAFFAFFSSSWNAVLTETQRQSWNAFVINTSNIFGLPKTIKGKTAFVRLNQNIAKVLPPTTGTVPLPDVPVPASVPAAEFAATATGSVPGPAAMSLDIDDLSAFPNAYVLIRATALQSPGTFKPGKSKYRVISAVASSVTTAPVDILAAYETKFGNGWETAPGSKIFYQIQIVDSTTGLTSVVTSAQAIVA